VFHAKGYAPHVKRAKAFLAKWPRSLMERVGLENVIGKARAIDRLRRALRADPDRQNGAKIKYGRPYRIKPA
jgi:hypothetical protein